MEALILIPLILIAGYLFGKQMYSRNDNNNNKTSITKIDNKNWIVNNEFVSFEEDTPLLRFQQEMEDNKHYNEYESSRLQQDRDRVLKDFLKTKKAITEYPDLKNCITNDKLETITDKYDKYLKMCDKLNENWILTKEEFLIKEENPAHCVDFIGLFWKQSPLSCYTIFNEKTAKYANNNMKELICQEFKERWY